MDSYVFCVFYFVLFCFAQETFTKGLVYGPGIRDQKGVKFNSCQSIH